MFIPRYSLRLLLGLLTACSVLFFVLARGLGGHPLAAGLGAAAVTVAAVLLVHTVGFVCLASLAWLTRRWRPRGTDATRMALLAATIVNVAPANIASGQQFSALTSLSPAQANSVTVAGHGLTLNVDANWPGGHYRPLLVQIAAAKTIPPVERRLTLVATMDSYYMDRKRQRVEQSVTVPGDGSTVQVWLAVPDIPPANAARLEVIEKGRSLQNLGAWMNVSYPGDGWIGGVSAPAIVVIDSAAPNSSALRQVFPEDERMEWGTSTNPPRPLTTTSPPLPTLVSILPTLALPTRSLDYSGLDVVSLPLATARQLAQAQPLAWQAICRWCASGGNLWLHGGGKNWEKLPEVDQLAPAMPGAAPTDVPRASEAAAGWYEPRASDYAPRILAPDFTPAYSLIEQRKQDQIRQAYAAKNQAQLGGAPAGSPNTADPELTQALQAITDEAAAKSQPVPVKNVHFVWRPHGLGSVAVFRADSAFPGTPAEWGAVLNTLTPQRWNWERRHGLQAHVENPDFWRMLIPGVGFARVWTFQALITGFVIVAGPLNYWWCRRRKRLHLLLVTVPCLALVAAGGLIGYALAADGLGVQFRARSVTLLDERSGRSACWSWQSYYGGVSPAGGLLFDDDTFLLSIGPLTGASLGGGDRSRHLIWNEGQRLRSGWLSARTPEQLLAVRSRQTKASLKLLPAAQPGIPPRVRNEMGSALVELFVADQNGSHFQARGISAGATATLAPLEESPQAALAKIARDNDLTFPAEMQAAGLVGPGKTLSLYGNSAWSPLDIRSGSALGERTIAAALEHNRWLAPGRYLAVVERSPEVQTGVPTVRESASFHIVLGQW